MLSLVCPSLELSRNLAQGQGQGQGQEQCSSDAVEGTGAEQFRPRSSHLWQGHMPTSLLAWLHGMIEVVCVAPSQHPGMPPAPSPQVPQLQILGISVELLFYAV